MSPDRPSQNPSPFRFTYFLKRTNGTGAGVGQTRGYLPFSCHAFVASAATASGRTSESRASIRTSAPWLSYQRAARLASISKAIGEPHNQRHDRLLLNLERSCAPVRFAKHTHSSS